MYRPAHFQEERLDVLQRMMREHSFATVVTLLGGELFATHLPLLLDAGRGPYGTLLGHMARANPHWRAFAAREGGGEGGGGDGGDREGSGDGGQEAQVQSLVIFQGPHAYVTPSWYTQTPAVPTWNYTAVHAYGRGRVLQDPAAVRRLLGEMVDTYESAFERPWSMAGLPEPYAERMAGAVAAFELPIERLEGKLKLSQNRPPVDRAAVRAGLRQQGDPLGLAMAQLMEQLEPQS